jgi:hypothetical protein
MNTWVVQATGASRQRLRRRFGLALLQILGEDDEQPSRAESMVPDEEFWSSTDSDDAAPVGGYRSKHRLPGPEKCVPDTRSPDTRSPDTHGTDPSGTQLNGSGSHDAQSHQSQGNRRAPRHAAPPTSLAAELAAPRLPALTSESSPATDNSGHPTAPAT